MNFQLCRVCLALCALLMPAAILGCSEETNGVDEEQIRGEFEREVWKVAEYTVRGVVVALPQGDDELQVRHEAIPEFRGPDKMGMDAMVMPFPLGEGVSLDGVAVGDKLSLTFSVDYEEGWSPIRHRVVEFEKLPGETDLDFTPLPKDDDEE